MPWLLSSRDTVLEFLGTDSFLSQEPAASLNPSFSLFYVLPSIRTLVIMWNPFG